MTSHTPAPSQTSPAAPHVCPWWIGPLLASPLRRLFESPERLLAPFVGPGMTVIEPGCGMGFFSLPLARLVGPAGVVVTVDLQPRMIEGLLRRARRAGLVDRIRPVVCTADDAGLAEFRGTADVAVAIHMLHEVPDGDRLLRQIFDALAPGGTLVVMEPAGHVSPEAFERTIASAEAVGFERTARRVAGRGLSAVLARPAAA
jgi:ubiquinone/menaquinone biosynthesis C-methylase UbiE